MKKFFCAVVIGMVILSVSGCRSGTSENSLVTSENTVGSSVISSSRTRSEPEESEESEENLPNGILRKDKDTLSVTLKSVSVYDVAFPSEFSIQDEDLIPERGIYLQNDEGTATLLIELVDDNSLENHDLEDYIKAKYPDAEVSATEEDVICIYEKTDENENDCSVFQMTRTTDNGYITALLCCRDEDRETYRGVFEKISITEISDND